MSAPATSGARPAGSPDQHRPIGIGPIWERNRPWKRVKSAERSAPSATCSLRTESAPRSTAATE